MEDNAMGLNAGTSGRKRRLSSDDNETPIKQQKAIVKENANSSSRESTPRIIRGKSTRSKRVLSSDSSDNPESSEDDSEKLEENSLCKRLSDSSSDNSSDEEPEDESDSESDSSLPARSRRKVVKKESSTPRISSHIKVESKQTRRASTGTGASSAKSKSSKSSISKSRDKTAGKSNAKVAVQKKRVSKEKISSISHDEDSDEEEAAAYVPRRDRDHKQILVSAILCRWWHVLPDWPPPDTNYQALLKERNLRLVSIDDWEEAPDVDEHGFTKVYQLSEYTGVFRDSNGNAHDLRPKENKPCYSNLIKMEEGKLYELLVTALENQIKTLETDSPGDSKLINELKVELVEAQALLSRKVLNKRK